MFHCDINEVYSRESISKPGRTGPGSGRVKVSSQIYEWTEIPRAHSSHTVVREVSQRADAGCLAREDGWAPPLGFGREGAACLPSKDARIRSGGDGGDGLRLPSFPGMSNMAVILGVPVLSCRQFRFRCVLDCELREESGLL